MLVQSTNLSIYETDVRLYVGDLAETAYTDEMIYTALVNSIYYLSTYWQSKYLIYSSGIVNSVGAGYIVVNTPNGTCQIPDTIEENDVFRNCAFPFNSVSPPVIEQKDVPAVLLAASYLLRRSSASSSYTGLSWSTPDLSFSNIQTSKALQEYIKQDLAALEFFFKVKLGKIQVDYPKGNFEIVYNAVDAVNWYVQMSKNYRFNY